MKNLDYSYVYECAVEDLQEAHRAVDKTVAAFLADENAETIRAHARAIKILVQAQVDYDVADNAAFGDDVQDDS